MLCAVCDDETAAFQADGHVFDAVCGDFGRLIQVAGVKVEADAVGQPPQDAPKGDFVA